MAAAQAVQLIGMPEARLNLAQAVIALAVAPKSNAVITGDRRRRAPTCGPARSARCRRTCATPTTAGRKKLGHGQGYRYAHDAPYGVAEQQYAPDVRRRRRVLPAHRPRRRGARSRSGWERLRRILRGGRSAVCRVPGHHGMSLALPAPPARARWALLASEDPPHVCRRVAGLVAAVAFVALVALLAVPILRAGPADPTPAAPSRA